MAVLAINFTSCYQAKIKQPVQMVSNHTFVKDQKSFDVSGSVNIMPTPVITHYSFADNRISNNVEPGIPIGLRYRLNESYHLSAQVMPSSGTAHILDNHFSVAAASLHSLGELSYGTLIFDIQTSREKGSGNQDDSYDSRSVYLTSRMLSYGIQGYYGLESVDNDSWWGGSIRVGGFLKTGHFFMEHHTDELSKHVTIWFMGPALQGAVKLFKYGELYLGGALPVMLIDTYSNGHLQIEVDLGLKISI